MKYLKQFAHILAFSFLGELCHSLIPAPVPASIYGLALLFLALVTGMLKLKQVKESGSFLVSLMAVLFVSPVVGLLNCWNVIRENFLAIALIIIVSLMVTFAISGIVTQLLLKKEGGNEND